MGPERGTRRRNGSLHATGEGWSGICCTQPSNDAQQADVGERRAPVKLNCRKHKKIGTWNVRTLLETGKLNQVVNEAERLEINVLGLAEHRWSGKGHFTPEAGGMLVYSGGVKSGRNGVAVFVRKEWSNSVLGYNPISDRLMTIRISGKPTNLTIIQTYAPTSQADDEEIEEFDESLGNAIENSPKRDFLLIFGDLNAKVGRQQDSNESKCVGKHGLSDRNERGQLLVDFAAERELSIMNTFFQHHPKRLYTWTTPDGQYQNQIDYIITPRRWFSSVLNVKTYPGADCGSDHELLLAKIKIKLKKLEKKTTAAEI